MSYQNPISYYDLNAAGQLVSDGTNVILRTFGNLSANSIYISFQPIIDGGADTTASWEIKAGKDFTVYGNAVLYAADPTDSGAPLQVWEFYT